MLVKVSARVFPTESEERVKEAIVRLFPGIELSRSGQEIVGESRDPAVLDRFRESIRLRKIRDSVEDILNKNWRDGRTWIKLNKQDATLGVFNVSEESPLGSILLEIEIPRERIHDLVWG